MTWFQSKTLSKITVAVLIVVLVLEVSWALAPCPAAYGYDCTAPGGAVAVAAITFWKLITSLKTEVWVALATIAIAYFTYALSRATDELKRSTDKLWDAGNKQIAVAQKSADAAMLSAKTAELQTKTAQESLLISNRAWVFTQPWPHTATIDPYRGMFLFSMELTPYGRVPATVIEIYVECADTAPTGETSSYAGPAIKTSVGLAPGNRWLQNNELGEPFETEWARPFIFGFVRYRDQFGTHTSSYCTKLIRIGEDKVGIETAGTPAWSAFD
jgi:hypothetical protein